jgi:hypothetical protein
MHNAADISRKLADAMEELWEAKKHVQRLQTQLNGVEIMLHQANDMVVKMADNEK